MSPRRGLVKSVHKVTSVCGGRLFLRYEDDKGNIYIYTNSDKLWINYSKEGFKLNSKEKRIDRNGSVIKHEKFDLNININTTVEENKALNENAIITTVTSGQELPNESSINSEPHQNASLYLEDVNSDQDSELELGMDEGSETEDFKSQQDSESEHEMDEESEEGLFLKRQMLKQGKWELRNKISTNQKTKKNTARKNQSKRKI